MVHSEAAVLAVCYGHLRGDSRSTIQENMDRLGHKISAGAISNLIEKHFDPKGRVRNLRIPTLRFKVYDLSPSAGRGP